MTPTITGVATAKVGRFIGLAHSGEEQLADALTLLADRHDRDADVRDLLTTFARWTRERRERLAALAPRYGELKSEHPQRLRASLYYGTRMGGVGLVQDLQDLLVHHVEVATFYLTLQQVAQEMRDQELLALAERSHQDVERQLAWVKTRLKRAAPQAIVVPSDPNSEIPASVPKRPSLVAQPDAIWAPLAGALMLGVVGLVAFLVGRPVLLPSLGPTAYLIAENPAHPTSRFPNVVGGHAAGAIAGLAAVMLFGVLDAPSPIATGVVAPARVFATILGIALLLAFALPLRVSHPPAAATTLLVTLGLVRTPSQFFWLALGTLTLAVVGELMRRVRLRHLPPAPEPREAERLR